MPPKAAPRLGTGVSIAPSELVSPERGKYAPVFYSCACSFTKYVVERTSLERVVNLFPLIPDRKVDGAGTYHRSFDIRTSLRVAAFYRRCCAVIFRGRVAVDQLWRLGIISFLRQKRASIGSPFPE